uniref:Uncharacterized protein n=1 Tax=Arundo donax TaxID=35708 RepID=A0A0A9U765_ARUDO
MSHSNGNQTGFCPPKLISQIANLTASYTCKNSTASYTCQSEELSMVSSALIMFILIGFFLIGLSDVRASLHPKFRLLLSLALYLFLPVMSYLFSEAKDSSSSASGTLSVRPTLILVWMLSVELLRKKVDEIRVQGSYSSIIKRAGRVVWLGNLVFFNTSGGRKMAFTILWIVCATKLVQRIAFAEVEKRSYPNKSWPIFSYMAQILSQGQGANNDEEQVADREQERLKRCKYIVMGEEKLVGEPTADGYKLNMNTTDDDLKLLGIITVSEVWKLADKDKRFAGLDRDQRIRRLCLSFALFKLLRGRFEHLPEIAKEEAHDVRDLLMKGLHYNNDEKTAIFQVMADEVNFLYEYYHSVVPVVLASPLFLLLKYFLLPVVVVGICFLALLLCANGHLSYAFTRISEENFALQPGFAKLAICTLIRAAHSRPAFFFVVDFSITLLLFNIFFYEEVWEFLVVLKSNWFVISLLCNYVSKPRWSCLTFSLVLRCIMCLRDKKSNYTNIRLKQFSLVNHRWPLILPIPYFLSLKLRSVPVKDNMKQSIEACLVEHDRQGTPLTNGKSVLLRNNSFHQLSWACDNNSVAEVILTWHIATCLLEAELPPNRSCKEEADLSKVANRLSKYCAYLVVFHPELLPDRRAKAELVLEETKEELRSMLGCWGYYMSLPRARVKKLLEKKRHVSPKGTAGCCWSEIQGEAARRQSDRKKVVLNGAELGRQLIEKAGNNNDGRKLIWKIIADLWTELVIYVAPSNDEEHVKGHEEILVEGVELITVLWAFTMHTGISRPPKNPTNDGRPEA